MELEPPRPRLSRTRSTAPGRDTVVWLDAWTDPVAGVKAFGSCITTCNLCGDGDWRLVVADADKKLKVGCRVGGTPCCCCAATHA